MKMAVFQKFNKIDLLSRGFMSHSFRRRFPKPISWLGMEKTKPNTIKAHMTCGLEMERVYSRRKG